MNMNSNCWKGEKVSVANKKNKEMKDENSTGWRGKELCSKK